MLGQPHIVDVCLLRAGVGQFNGLFPEAESIHRGIAFRHGEKALAVIALHAGNQIVFSVQFNGTGVKHRIHAKAFHKIRVGRDV